MGVPRGSSMGEPGQLGANAHIHETCDFGGDQRGGPQWVEECPPTPHRLPFLALRAAGFPFLAQAAPGLRWPVTRFLPSQVMRHDNSSILELDGKEVSVFTPSKPREKWQRKRTHVKLRVRGPHSHCPAEPSQDTLPQPRRPSHRDTCCLTQPSGCGVGASSPSLDCAGHQGRVGHVAEPNLSLRLPTSSLCSPTRPRRS